jgi:hypothetical protein
MTRIDWTRREMLERLREVVHGEGRGVTLRVFLERTGVPESQIRREFGTWTAMRREAGLRPEDRDRSQVPDDQLWEEYAQVVKQLSRLPSTEELDRLGRFSARTYRDRFGPQAKLKRAFRAWLLEQRPPAEDERICNVTADAPRNGTPDLPLLRSRWRKLRVTFAVRSSDFRDRPVQDWELLVVLEHDWPNCPLKVLELSDVVGNPHCPPGMNRQQPVLPPTRAELYGRMPWEREG